ncbi:MAG TPA: hypothetical protein PLE45_00845 [Spirochaetota bacterium]|nr:hypothetical protein [Spirochaetota bacterium]HOL56080.1 hypothetical protein [Spirochaetota bacterium]HPP03506.1 hypothetical protein [Spirochaetota bacterium]
MHNWKNLLFIILISFLCCKQNVYKNSKYGYKVEFPENWIAINSNIDRSKQEEFKKKIESENGLVIYKNVDVAFYNPLSSPPVYDIISISTIRKVINIDNVLKNKKEIDYTLEYQLREFFSDVTMVYSDFPKYRNGKAYRVDFVFKYKNINCYASTVIFTNSLFYSNMITAISRAENQFELIQLRDRIINSFRN